MAYLALRSRYITAALTLALAFAVLPTSAAAAATAPGAMIAAQVCGESFAVVSLTNPGDQPVVFAITKNDVNVRSLTVGPHRSDATRVPVGPAEEALIYVSADGRPADSRAITNSCAAPSAYVAACATGGAVVTLTNPGTVARAFVVSRNGAAFDSVSVAANTAVTRSYAGAGTAGDVVDVSAPGLGSASHGKSSTCPTAGVSTAISLSADGSTAVAGVSHAPVGSPTPAATGSAHRGLPHTGASGLGWLLVIGVASIVIGIPLFRMRRSRRMRQPRRVRAR